MELRCHACAHNFAVPAGTLSASCEKCGALITLTALETRARGLVARDQAAPEALLNTELGGYLLTAVLGGGGMGVVYEAKRTERATFPGPDIAAIKVLSPAFALDAEFIERFRRESDALTKLRHANLVEVYAKGESPHYFFVMERFFGEDLRSFMARGPVDPARAAAIVRGAAQGLAYAHANGIVHRDVKPANILVSGDSVKVVDFGVAQLATGQYTLTSLTRSELVLGTINYMSPEQRVDASEVDHRADVYALGVVAYELLTGRLPIGAFEPPSELGRVGKDADRAVMSALRRDPAQRPKSATLFAESFERALVKKPRRLAPYAIAATVLVASTAGAAAWMNREPEPTKREVAKTVAKTVQPVEQVAEQAQQGQQAVPEDPILARTANALLAATDYGLKRAQERAPQPKIAVKEPVKKISKKPSPKSRDVVSKKPVEPSFIDEKKSADVAVTKDAPKEEAPATKEAAIPLKLISPKKKKSSVPSSLSATD